MDEFAKKCEQLSPEDRKGGGSMTRINRLDRDDLKRVMRGVLGLTVEEKARLLGVLRGLEKKSEGETA